MAALFVRERTGIGQKGVFVKGAAGAAAGPTLGQHTEEILQSLGYTVEQLAELKRAKVI